MATAPNQFAPISDLGILHWQLEIGLLETLLVTENGRTAIVPAKAVCSVFMPAGEVFLYGDFTSLGEHEIALMLTDKATGAVMIQTEDERIITIEPAPQLITCYGNITIQGA